MHPWAARWKRSNGSGTSGAQWGATCILIVPAGRVLCICKNNGHLGWYICMYSCIYIYICIFVLSIYIYIYYLSLFEAYHIAFMPTHINDSLFLVENQWPFRLTTLAIHLFNQRTSWNQPTNAPPQRVTWWPQGVSGRSQLAGGWDLSGSPESWWVMGDGKSVVYNQL